MKGPCGRHGSFLALFSLLCLNLPKRHLTHIQDMFYQTFRYFVKQKRPPQLIFYHLQKLCCVVSYLFGFMHTGNSKRPKSVPCGTPLRGFPVLITLLVNGAFESASCVLIMLNSRLFWRNFLMFLAVSRCPAAAAQTPANRTSGEVRLAVIAPIDLAANEQTLQQILPPVKLAVRAVTDPVTGILPGWKIHLLHRNSNCSSTIGPLAAVELHKDLGKLLAIQF